MAGTVTNSIMNSYSDAVSGGTTPAALNITTIPDWSTKLRRTDTPLLKLVGGIKEGAAPTNPELKALWGWSSPDPVRDQLAEALDDSETVVTVDRGNYFQVGNVLRVDEERFLVTAISGNDLTVLRGFQGSIAAVHDDDSPVYILGVAIRENQDDPLSPITQGETDFNYPQIMIWTWEFSQRSRVTPTWESKNYSGTRDQQELRKKMEKTAPVFLERTLLEGLRHLGAPGTEPSTMGGFMQPSYITTQADLNGAPLTEYDFFSNLQTVYNLVGQDDMAKTFIVSGFGKRIINSWYNDTRRTTGGDTKISVKWDSIESDFGTVRFIIDYQLDALGRQGYMFAVNPEDITLRPYHSSTGWQTGDLATQGWYTHGFLRGDFTAIFKNCDSNLMIYDFSTSAAAYPGLV